MNGVWIDGKFVLETTLIGRIAELEAEVEQLRERLKMSQIAANELQLHIDIEIARADAAEARNEKLEKDVHHWQHTFLRYIRGDSTVFERIAIFEEKAERLKVKLRAVEWLLEKWCVRGGESVTWIQSRELCATELEAALRK